MELLLSPVGLVMLFIAIYMGSCVIHPFERCKACGGSKESHSAMFKGAYGPCRSCGGRGHHVRFGARLLGKG